MRKLPKVIIKHPNQHSRESKESLLKILSKHDVYLTRAIPIHDGFLSILADEKYVDNLFKKTTLNDLAAQQFLPVFPPDIMAQRTILLFGVSSHILQHTPQEIQEEIQRLNEFTDQKIDAVYKFPNNEPILKIIFNTPPDMKCLENGIKMFCMRIPADNIKLEEYISVQTCTRCYKIAEHKTNKCPKDKNYKVCSECGKKGHTWESCQSDAKKCLNCGGDHRTLAHKCPVMKAAIQKTKELEEQRKNQTSCNGTSNTLPTTTNPAPILDQKTSQMFACMLQALVIDLGYPGSYEKALHDLFVAQDLPPIKVPQPPNSSVILRQIFPQVPASFIPPPSDNPPVKGHTKSSDLM